MVMGQQISRLMDGDLDDAAVEAAFQELKRPDGVGPHGLKLSVDQQRNFLRCRRRRSAALGAESCLEVNHYHLRSLSVPKSGRNCSAIASRARKIRERTVPTGQFITLAISS